MEADRALSQYATFFQEDGDLADGFTQIPGYDKEYSEVFNRFSNHTGLVMSDGSLVIYDNPEWVVFGEGFSEYSLAYFEEELMRVGVADIGPVDSICVTTEGADKVRFYDDSANSSVDVAEAYERLEGLPDNAGWEAFWESFRD